VPGSGKTYYAVSVIDREFFKVKDSKYLTLFTNVAQFNFHEFQSRAFKRDLKFNSYAFDFNKFIVKVEDLYSIYKDKNKTENDLVEFAKSINFYKALFIIDEAHNYFNKENEALTFFLTYHRHLYVDLYFVTQNAALFHSKYLALSELFYSSLRRSRALSSSFSYTVFGSFPLSKDNQLESLSLKPSKEIFQYYESGGKVNSKSYGKKYIIMFAVGLIFFIFYLFYAASALFTAEKVDQNLTRPAISVTQIIEEEEEEKTYNLSDDCFNFRLQCDTQKDFCVGGGWEIDLSGEIKKGLYSSFAYPSAYIFNTFADNDISALYEQRDRNTHNVILIEYCVDPEFIRRYFFRFLPSSSTDLFLSPFAQRQKDEKMVQGKEFDDSISVSDFIPNIKLDK